MSKLSVTEALDTATLEQKDRLLEMNVRRQGMLEDLAALEIKFKVERKAIQTPLAALEVDIFALLEEVATGQRDLFDSEAPDPTPDDEPAEPAPE